jgi:cell division protein FtsB
MQPQRKPNWLPLSLFSLAAAIAFAGWLIASTIASTSSAQVAAQQRAAYNASELAKMQANATLTQGQAMQQQQFGNWVLDQAMKGR